MYITVHVTYDVETICYGGQGFKDDIHLIGSFETVEEARACAAKWKETNPNAIGVDVRIFENVHSQNYFQS